MHAAGNSLYSPPPPFLSPSLTLLRRALALGSDDYYQVPFAMGRQARDHHNGGTSTSTSQQHGVRHPYTYDRHRPGAGVWRKRRTSPFAWLLAVFCTLFWVLVILGGLAILIVYLVIRPRTPRVEISSATVNAAYIDAGNLLNADVTLLANFTNPNRKLDLSFAGGVSVDLYYNGTLVATQGIPGFQDPRLGSSLWDVHLVASQMQLPPVVADGLRRRVTSGAAVGFEVQLVFVTRFVFTRVVQVPYALHTQCFLVLGAPPSGALQSSRCSTKH